MLGHVLLTQDGCMTAEGMPAAEESLLAAPMERLTRLVLRFPRATIGVAVVLAVVCLGLTAARLGYRTSRLDLLNPNSDYNRRWIEYLEEFGGEDDAVVVVEGDAPAPIIAAIDEIAATLARDEALFHAVLHKVDLARIEAKGLHYLPPEKLVGIEHFLDQTLPIVEGDWSRLKLSNMAVSLSAPLGAPNLPPEASLAAAAGLDRLASGVASSLGPQPRYQSPWPDMAAGIEMPGQLSSGYLLAPDGRMGFVLLRLAPGEDQFAKGTEATDALRTRIGQIQQRHPATKIGLTGLPILENDEMRASSSSMAWASLISFIGVAVLFVAGFGGIRHALLANLVLLLGMAWSFGYVTLAVGHLNILSVSFTVTLIGIGIDYGIHYISRYLQLRRQGQDCHAALLATSRGISPAIATGAVTTAVSFYAAAFTSFTGIAELGMIAGGGILLCAVAELVVLPAAVLLVDGRHGSERLPEPLPVHRWIAPCVRRPRLVLGCTVALTLLVGGGSSQLWYDQNLLNMQPAGLESVALERKLLEQSGQSAWYALSVADSREALLARKAALIELPSVERVEEIVSLLPRHPEQTRPVIERIGQRLASLPAHAPLIPVDRPEALLASLAKVEQMAAQAGLTDRCRGSLEPLREAIGKTAAANCFAALSQYQQQLASDLLARLHMLRTMADPTPPELSDLPPSLVARFVGRHERHLLKIYGRGNIWDTQNLARFVSDVRSVDPDATGNPVQAFEASREMKQSYQNAALYALVIIIGVLVFDFRRLRDAALAAAPLGLGMLQMFGLMGLLDIPLNPANMLALPLILGIGVDYGVHIVHEYREMSGRYRMSSSTAVAVMVDSLTTIVGFGSLMIASHQGLESLGRVLTIGVSCCLFTSVVMLPAFLTWLTRHRAEERDEQLDEPLQDVSRMDEPRGFEFPDSIASYTGGYLRRDGAHREAAAPHLEPAPRRTSA
jgi:hopanoid biosynthesis associated RND transporter like protein HpnN